MINSVGVSSSGLLSCIGIFFAFAFVFIMLKNCMDKLPHDQGREFAVNGALSKGKPRGAGLIFVMVFIVATCMFDAMSIEKAIYLVLLALEMLTGYLDDSSKAPWGELKKGLLDFAIALVTSITYVYFNGSTVILPILGLQLDMHPVLYVILGVILIWVSINVTNCTDGVDSLSGTLTIITLGSFYCLESVRGGSGSYWIMLFIAALIGYQWYNAKPSLVLMGDAGSRAMGFFIAVVAMKSGCPIMYIPLAIMMILDGGLGLLKVSFIRFLKMKNFMKNIKTPLHDNARKVMEWSDPQTVYRFAIIQFMVSVLAIYLVK